MIVDLRKGAREETETTNRESGPDATIKRSGLEVGQNGVDALKRVRGKRIVDQVPTGELARPTP